MDDFAKLCRRITELQNLYDNVETRTAAKEEMVSLWRKMNPCLVRPPDSRTDLGAEDAIVVAMLRSNQKLD